MTEEDKLRVRDEEVYRSEVRRELEAQKSKPTTRSGKVWAFVQTSLGIWLLSTVVVGLITWGYTQLQGALQRSNAQLQVVQHADAEAKSRVQQWLNMCNIRWVQSEFATSKFQWSGTSTSSGLPRRTRNIRTSFTRCIQNSRIGLLFLFSHNCVTTCHLRKSPLLIRR